jgi:opine dehydrogenase
MAHKYVTEDVPCGLVPMSALGEAVGVATPVIDGLIALSSAMLGRDFRTEGRNREYLGLEGRNAEQVRHLFEVGPSA